MNSQPTPFFADGVIPQRIVSLISEATKEVFLVTPYLEPWRYLTESLLLGIRRGISTIAIVRDEPKVTGGEGVRWLVTNGAKVLAVPGLHAKIYMNERTIILSSLNLTEQSLNMSHDIGLQITDIALQESIRSYVRNTLLPIANPLNFRESAQFGIPRYQSRAGGGPGFCIRCGLNISFNRKRPLCDDCYGVWSIFGNLDYLENFCHVCGKPAEVSYSRPACAICYAQVR